MPPKKSKKRKVQLPPPEELFEVEVVTKARVVRINEKQSLKSSKKKLVVDYDYLVKWVGYTSDDDSWEPAENLDQCGPMLREFWENIDSLNPIGCTSTVGKVFSASEEWIAQRKLLSNKPEAPDFDGGASDTSDDIPLSRILTQPKRKAPLTITLPGSASKRQKTTANHDVQGNTDSIPTTENVQTSTINPRPEEPIKNSADPKKTPPVEHHSITGTPHQIADSQPRYLEPVQDDTINVFSDQFFDLSLLEPIPPHPTEPPAEVIVDERQNFPMAVENNPSLPVTRLNFHGKLIPASVIKVKDDGGICPTRDQTLPDELAVSRAYSIADVQSLVPCYLTSQKNILFTLQSLEPGEGSFDTAVRYFIKHRQVALIPILDVIDPHMTLGHYFVIPFDNLFRKVISEIVYASLSPLVESLNRASDAPQFLVVPLRLSVGRQPLDAPITNYPTRSITVPYLRSTIPSSASARWIHLFKNEPWFTLGLNVLNIPSELLMWLGTDTTEKRFLLWNDYSLSLPNASKYPCCSTEGRLESLMMFTILKELGLPEARSTDALRVLFVHAESLRRPGVLARLTDLKRIYKPAMPIIYCYGSSCGRIRRVEEIYPCGGVVTFTPQALLEGHCYASRLMEKLHEHPLWSSYIIPLTLGILVGMSEREQDTNEYATRVVKQVYKNVTAGYISLITSAPPSAHPGNVAANCKSAWLAKYLSAVPPSPTRARALSLLELAQAQASIETNDQYLLGEISKDIIAMQQQPAIMRQYRRFVVIMGDSEAEEVGEQWQGKDGAEWITLSQFDFADGFFNYK